MGMKMARFRSLQYFTSRVNNIKESRNKRQICCVKRLTRWRQLRRLFYYWRHYYNMSVYSRKTKTIIRGMRDTYVYGLSLGYPVDANTLLHQYVDSSDLEYVKKKVGNMHSEPSTRQTER